jgi:hypothetical protein
VKVVNHFEIPIGVLDVTYHIFVNLIYQIARCHTLEGNNVKSEKKTLSGNEFTI